MQARKFSKTPAASAPGERRGQATTAILACLIVSQLATVGCVRRRMTVRSNPPGAMVSIDQQEIGTTPVSVDYTYYGVRNFVVSKEDHETVSASRTFSPPWYQYPPLDFLTENLWPFELRDERVVEFQLIPRTRVRTEDLVARGEQLRSTSRSGVVIPLPDTSPAVAPPANLLPPPANAYPTPQNVSPPAVLMPPR
jgi:hypothetical protein